MDLSPIAEAVLLLTSHFSKPQKGDPRPLTPTEWGRLSRWLKEHEISPEALVESREPEQVLVGWVDKAVSPQRIQWLVSRGLAMGIALEKWHRAGLWVMTRSDPDYPVRLKRLLGFDAPPLLFGCGDRRLLGEGGVAVVGSRDASEADLLYTARLGGQAAGEGFNVVSGGARGIDEAAMLGALEKDGTAVGIMADSLLRAATSAKYRKWLMSSNLVLASPYYPEAGFDVGNAMARNKYVYCLADLAVVIVTAKEKGGTWAGATEDLKKGWTPLWVKPQEDRKFGNAELVSKGANWLPMEAFEIGQLIAKSRTGQVEDIPDVLLEREAGEEAEPLEPLGKGDALERGSGAAIEGVSEGRARGATHEEEHAVLHNQLMTLPFYELFLGRLELLTATDPVSVEELLRHFGVTKAQLLDWLKRGVAEGKISKLARPVRYQAITAGQQSLGF
jgi:predicted Rossmann fold nucleotide-binding protein DprA/Smf involved in DNA uptake